MRFQARPIPPVEQVFSFITEHNINQIIVQNLWCNATLATWFGNQVGIEGAIFQKVETYPRKQIGERSMAPDLLISLDHAGGRAALLIENKITHALTDQQADGYA